MQRLVKQFLEDEYMQIAAALWACSVMLGVFFIYAAWILFVK